MSATNLYNGNGSSVNPKASQVINETTGNTVEQDIANLSNAISSSGGIVAISQYLAMIFGNAYPNTASYFMTFETSTTCARSAWLALPNGTYNVTCAKALRIYQSDTIKFAKDFAVRGTDVILTSWVANATTTLAISKKYIMFVADSVSSDDDLTTLVKIDSVSLTSAAASMPTYTKPHIAAYNSSNAYVYLPLKSGEFTVYHLKKYSEYSAQKVHHGIDTVYMTNPELKCYSPAIALTRSSEYEQALNVTSDTHSGYIGGHMHGYELEDDIELRVDGVVNSTWQCCDDAEQIDIIMHSTLYETDMTTEIAKVTKRWRWADGAMHIFVNTIFSKSLTLTQAQTAMFGILRKVGDEYLTCRAVKDTDWRIVNTEDEWDTTSPSDGYDMLTADDNEATYLEQWGDMGLHVSLEVPKASRFTGAGMFISTNGGGTYNKMYYNVGSKAISSGDIIFSHSIFKIW